MFEGATYGEPTLWGSLAGALLLTSACAPAPYGQVSDGWTISAGTRGGGFVDRVKPTAGRPLALSAQARPCLRDADVLAALGPTCNHESENAASAAPIGDLPGGIPEPSKEVRWYCADRFVVRVVLERCDAGGTGNLDGIKPVEISLAPHHQP